MAGKPLRATDKRRSGAGTNVTQTVAEKKARKKATSGAGKPLFTNNAKHPNGAGKRASR